MRRPLAMPTSVAHFSDPIHTRPAAMFLPRDRNYDAYNPAFVDAIICFSSHRAIHRQFFHEIEQRHMAFGKIGILRQPVIHFCIDVRGIVAAPWRLHCIVPDSLQVGWA
jgi:hypothetical protein